MSDSHKARGQYDYAEAVSGGQVINVSEYNEMVEFSQLIVDKSSLNDITLADSKNLAMQAGALQIAIQNTEALDIVRRLTASLRSTVLGLMPQMPLPYRLLSQEATQLIFERYCASCHGLSGQGDGELSGRLDPSPTDFTNRPRALNRSVRGLYDAIFKGIDDTGMTAFPQMTDRQRWSLAFYIGGLALQSSAPPSKKNLTISTRQLVNNNPIQLAVESPEITQANI